MVIIPELVLLEKEFLYKKKTIIFFISDNFICNEYFFKKLKKKIIILPYYFKIVYDSLLFLSSINYFFKNLLVYRSMQAYDHFDLLNKSEVIFNLTDREINEGNKIILDKIPKINNGIILLCCRDEDYNKNQFKDTNWENLNYRNYNIELFRETIEYLNKKKFVVLRMGKYSSVKINYKNEYFIDYVNSSWKSEFMDYFLAYKSKMCITTNTGMDVFARLFRKPMAQILFPLEDIYYFQKNIFNITGTFKNKRSKDILTLKEIFKHKLHSFSSLNNLTDYELIKNTSSEIKDFIIEVIERLDNKILITEDDKARQLSFWKIFFESQKIIGDPLYLTRNYKNKDNFSYSYLKKNNNFLR
jgi:putative glycosyltransferase (TIGR04372 family)